MADTKWKKPKDDDRSVADRVADDATEMVLDVLRPFVRHAAGKVAVKVTWLRDKIIGPEQS
jgi:hypothetical protein